MQAIKVLHKTFRKNIREIHKWRLDAVMECVESLISSKRLSLTWLGRYMKGDAQVGSNIKKVDRLLRNPRLHEELSLFYSHMMGTFFGAEDRPLLHVDWTCQSSVTKLYVLRASFSVKGRAIVAYEETHPKSKENNHATHRAFLAELKKVVPVGLNPIIVTDAGFRAPWFKLVLAMGWDFVGRLRNKNFVKLSTDSDWQYSKHLNELATGTAKSLGEGLLTKKETLRCKFVVYKGKKKRRKMLNKDGSQKRSSKSKRYAKAHSEPWVLITSLDDVSSSEKQTALQIVNIYKQRMQIEENLRDTKSFRYGYSLSCSGTKSEKRMNVLLLFAAIASYICWIAGVICRQRKISARYQAHSAKFKDALSIVYLGCEAIRRNIQIMRKEFAEAIPLIAQQALNPGLKTL